MKILAKKKQNKTYYAICNDNTIVQVKAKNYLGALKKGNKIAYKNLKVVNKIISYPELQLKELGFKVNMFFN